MTEQPPSVGAPTNLAAPRRRWVAVLLSVLAPGLGQLYVARPRRALAMWLGIAGVTLLLAASAAVLPAAVHLSLFLLAALIMPLYVLMDAARIARFNPLVAHHWYDRWYVYAALVVLASIVWSPYLAFVKRNVLEAYRIPSGSMAPTILEGDYLLATKLGRVTERGRLAIHTRGRQTFVQRIVGVPGDTLQMRDGGLLVNGRPVAEPYVTRAAEDATWPEFAWQEGFLLPSVDRSGYQPSLDNWGPLVAPADNYFLLGDNRGESLDSRFRGFVPAKSIVGRPTSIYFSLDPETSVPRWGRIGMSLRE